MLKIPTVFYAEGDVGGGGQPDPSLSQTPAGNIDGNASQLLTQLESIVNSRFEGLTKELRGLQSRQDKSENTFLQELARLEQYEKKGLTREQAIAEMNQVDSEAQWKSSLEKKLDDLLAGRSAGAGTQANAQQETGKVFESLGLDLKDPRVVLAASQKYDTPELARLAAYDLREQLSKSPNPNAAQDPSLNGNSPAKGNFEALNAEYESLSGQPSKNMQRMAEIQKELDSLLK